MYVVALRHAELAQQVVSAPRGAYDSHVELSGLTSVTNASEALQKLHEDHDTFLLIDRDRAETDVLLDELIDELAKYPKLIALTTKPGEANRTYALIDESRNLHLPRLDFRQAVDVLAIIAREMELTRCQSAQRQLLAEKNLRIGRLTESAHEFVDRLAHEFRSPISVIRDYATRVRDEAAGPITKGQAELMDTIINRNDELACQVDDMIDISRQHLGILGIHRSKFALAPVVDKVVAGLARMSTTYGVALDWSETDPMPDVFADPERIARALHCILFNGLKYAESGGRLEVRLSYDASAGSVGLQIVEPSSRWEDLDNLDEMLHAFETNPIGFDPRTGSLFGPGLGIARDLIRMNLGTLAFRSIEGGHPILNMCLPVADPQVLLNHFRDYRQKADRQAHSVSLVVIESIDREQAGYAAPAIDDFLQENQSSLGLIYPVSPQRWVYVVQRDARQIDDQNKRLLLQWDLCRQTSPMPNLPELRMSYLGCWDFDRDWPELKRAFGVAVEPTASLRYFRPKILLADPNADAVAGLVERLESFGYQVIPASDGQQCVEAAVADPPDAIVLNEGLTDPAGQRTLECLRNQMGSQSTPIILLSQDLRNQQHALQHGAKCLVAPADDAEGLRDALEESMTSV